MGDQQWSREKSAKGVAIGSRGAISSKGAPLLGAPYNTFFGVHLPQARRYLEVTATGEFRNLKSQEPFNFEAPMTCQQFAYISN